MLSANLSSEGDNDTDGGKGEGRGKSGPGYEEIETWVENSRSWTLRSGIVLHCLEVSHSCKCFFDNLFHRNYPSESFIDIMDNDDHDVHQLSVVTLKSAATTELGWVRVWLASFKLIYIAAHLLRHLLLLVITIIFPVIITILLVIKGQHHHIRTMHHLPHYNTCVYLCVPLIFLLSSNLLSSPST